jgi:hypothetical protein
VSKINNRQWRRDDGQQNGEPSQEELRQYQHNLPANLAMLKDLFSHTLEKKLFVHDSPAAVFDKSPAAPHWKFVDEDDD